MWPLALFAGYVIGGAARTGVYPTANPTGSASVANPPTASGLLDPRPVESAMPPSCDTPRPPGQGRRSPSGHVIGPWPNPDCIGRCQVGEVGTHVYRISAK